MALALIDPLRAVALVESLPDEPGLDRTLPKNAARLYTAEILAKEGQARWQKAPTGAFRFGRPKDSTAKGVFVES